MKLNLGSGNDYRKGWVNVDNNPLVKADKYFNLEGWLPFRADSVHEVLLDNTLEHLRDFFHIMEELHRVCKKGARIRIYTPHYSGMYAFKHPTHFKYFGIGTMDHFTEEETFNGERYSNARFKILKEELLFFHHNLVSFKFLSKLPINWLFNFSRNWQQLMERFQFLGFDEIYYELEVVK